VSFMHPDYKEGLQAWDAGAALDPAWPSQKRRGWERARERTAELARFWCQDVLRNTVRASERAAAESLLNATDQDLAEVFRQPPHVLEMMGLKGWGDSPQKGP
jgi:hypothetical protein